ncbi:TPA_asm: phage regulatory protein [Campylobacter jejuni]|nr:phage regulatory protein [Campylobacter jejuni]HAA1611853.1 phage regulatory protein [Campylobacter jejuni]HAA1642425.1 phage regulatory protein [Campylobacter jejuni]
MSNKVIINKQEVQFDTQNNQIFCTSLDVAKVFGKEHKNILRDIKNILNDLREIGDVQCKSNFELSFKVRKINEMQKLLQKEIKSPNKYLTDLMELIYPNLPQNDYKVSVIITDNPYSKEAKNVFSLNYLVDNRTPKDPKKLQ